MPWYSKLQFTAMLLAVAGLVADWHVGVWTALFFVLASVVSYVAQAVTTHRFANLSLRTMPRLVLLAIVLYWLLLLLTLLYSSDVDAARETLSLKASLLIFPLAFLLTDTRWLAPRHLRAVGHVLVLALIGSFLYHMAVALGRVADGENFIKTVSAAERFDPRHHTYTALYLTVAMMVVYYELYAHWDTLTRWGRGVLIAAVPVLITYTVLVNSRAGLVVMYGLEAFCVLHFALTRRRWLTALLLALALAGCTVGVERLFHGDTNRVVETASDVDKDVRVGIYKRDIEVAKHNPLTGYGVGDYKTQLDDYNDGVGETKFSPHNQYLETLLSMGVVGLAVLLFWLFAPLWMAWRAWRRKSLSGIVFWLLTVSILIVAFNFLFESIIERQMGLLFVGPLMTLIVLEINYEQNKFGQLPK